MEPEPDVPEMEIPCELHRKEKNPYEAQAAEMSFDIYPLGGQTEVLALLQKPLLAESLQMQSSWRNGKTRNTKTCLVRPPLI